MAKYHVSSDGNPRICTASEGNCPLGGNEAHFPSKADARAAFEEWVPNTELSSKNSRFGESVRTVNERGDVEWRNSTSQLHRDGDQPAFVAANGTKAWYQNDALHRDGGLPAVERPDGTKEWYRSGKLHRDNDLPAVERAGGTKLWYQNGKCHRDGGLPSIERPDGSKEWWVNGIYQYRVEADEDHI